MALQPGIILGGQGVNALGAIAAGNEAAARQKEFLRQQEYNAMLKQNGAGIVGGDMNALNALAAYDPAAALGVQESRLGMDARRQAMAFDAEEMQMRREQSKLEAQQWMAEQAATMTKDQIAAEAAQMEAALSGAAFFYQNQDRAGYDAFLQSKGINPAEYPFEQFPAHAAEFGGVLDAMKTFAPPDPIKDAPTGYMFTDPANPAAGVTPLPGYTKQPGVVVNTGQTGGPQPEIGTIPQGYQAVWDEQAGSYRMTPIPGGPEDRSQAQANAAADDIRQADIVLTKLEEAEKLVDGAGVLSPAVGFGAETMAQVGGTRAADMAATIDTIESNIAFDALAAMRAASPTGGALGSITERELALLGSTLASLKQSQSPAQFKQNLGQLRTIYKDIMRKAQAYPNAAQFGFGGAEKNPSEMSDEELLQLYGAD